MNIVLVEERAGKEYTFTKDLVTFGRDANECDIAFDSAQHPMVSRKHAEIRPAGPARRPRKAIRAPAMQARPRKASLLPPEPRPRRFVEELAGRA